MESLDRLSPGRRPPGAAAGYQSWRDLTFIHWRLPAEAIRPLLPPELTLDLWEGDAWVALVPFDMQRVRPWWSPVVPGVSWFHETNLRTYVHFRGEKPGVWFFSLEASNTIAVLAARWGWMLNYYRTDLILERRGDSRCYSGRRRWPRPVPATYDLTTAIGSPINTPGGSEQDKPGVATPGTLEHFLAERYYLYTTDGRGRLYRAQVHHPPYPLRHATVKIEQESILAAAGINCPGSPDHVLFSPGVDVEVFSLERVATASPVAG